MGRGRGKEEGKEKSGRGKRAYGGLNNIGLLGYPFFLFKGKEAV